MTKIRNLILTGFIITILLGGCQANSPTEPSNVTPSATSENLPAPQIRTTKIPSASSAARAYLDAWKAENYQSMYDMLSADSRASISLEDYQQKYAAVADEVAFKDLRYEIVSDETADLQSAKVNYRLSMFSNLLGEISRDTLLNLKLDQGAWKVVFDDGTILPDLAGGNTIRMDLNPPTRASIFDRSGKLLAGQTEATSIGFYPEFIDPENADGLFGLLSRASGLTSAEIRNRVENAVPGDYLAMGQVVTSENSGLLSALASYGAVVLTNYSSRYYPSNGIAPHLVGYVRALDKEELSEYRRLGYRVDEKVGRKGIERWGEEFLVGTHGGTLYQLDTSGVPIAELGSKASEAGHTINSTIDSDLQRGVQEALRGFRGAAVVLEKDTGRVLAMASSPGFDQNAFQTENNNWWATLPGIVNDPNSPEFNRATEGLYPLGSVFKVITTAAALESGVYPADYKYNCQYEFLELPGLPLYDWTWEHFQEDGETQPTGPLNSLAEGLIRSCNPLFYHLGKGLYDAGKTTAVAEMARAFGFSSKTGIEVVNEQAGVVPDPTNVVDATNLAIGQGDLQVTPLQVANFMAALGNGGTLYRPQAIEKITNADGTTHFEFKPEVIGSLPLKPETKKVLEEAMLGVVRSNKPRGTAYNVFNGFNIPVYGKTGTATSQTQDPHAWFAGYTKAEREDKSDIAIAVIAENAGEGSEISAPIFRRIVELYFQGRPGKLYPWEAAIGVTKTPTSIYTETPIPEETVEP